MFTVPVSSWDLVDCVGSLSGATDVVVAVAVAVDAVDTFDDDEKEETF